MSNYDNQQSFQIQPDSTNDLAKAGRAMSRSDAGSFSSSERSGVLGVQYRPEGLSDHASQGVNIVSHQNLDTHQRYTIGQDTAPAQSIWDTARTANGSPVSKITGDSVVTFQGMETTISALLAAGVMGVNADGSYYEKGRPEWQNSNPQRQQQGTPQAKHIAESMNDQEAAQAMQREMQQDWLQKSKGYSAEEAQAVIEYDQLRQQGHELLSNEQELAINSIVKDVPQGSYDQAIIEAISHDGDLSKVDWNSFGTKAGIDPQEAKQKAGFMQHLLNSKGAAILESFGINDPAEFMAWAKKSHPSDYHAMQREYFQTRKTSIAKELAADYVKSRPVPSASEFQQAGYETKKGNYGELLVFVPEAGQWFEAEKLTRMGAVQRA